MRMIYLLIMIVGMGLSVSAQTADRTYDRFKDETNISIVINEMPMDANYNSLSWSLGSSFTGQVIPSNPIVVMSMVVTSKEWRLLNADLTMRAIVDGERITVGEFKRNYSSVYHGATMEAASMAVSIDTLKKLVAGRKVEVQFFGIVSEPSENERSRISAFLTALDIK